MVAPRGKTNPDTLLETLPFSSKQLIVRGSVADDEAVEKAVKRATFIKLKRETGLFLEIKYTRQGKTKQL